MNEEHLARQDRGAVARMEAGAVAEIAPARLLLAANGKRVGIKQVRFAVTPGKMWHALLHRWILALAVAGLAAGIGAILAWATYKPKYTATAMMRMESNESRLLPGPDDGRNQRVEEFRKTQAQIIKSGEVIKAVVKKDEVRGLKTIRKAEDPVLWLEKELQAGFLPGTDIIQIWLSGEEPEEIARLVNTVKDVYLDQFVNATKMKQAARVDTIEKVVVAAEEKLRGQRELLRRLADTFKTGDTQVLTLKQRMVLDEFATMRRELVQTETEIRKLNAELTVYRLILKGQADEPPAQALIEEFLDRHPALQKQQFEISRVEAQVQDYQTVVTGASPRLAQLQEQVKAAHAQLQKLKTDLEPEIRRKVKEAQKRHQLNVLTQTEEKLKVLKEQHDVVEGEVTRLAKDAEKIGMGSFEMEMRRSEIEETDSVLKKLRGERERLGVEKLNNREIITANQPADVPSVNQASLLKSTLLYSLLGFLLGLLGISYFEARVHRVHKAAEFHQELGIETLGVLPRFGQKGSLKYGSGGAGDGQQPRDLFTEAVDGLCATVKCHDGLRARGVIMLTSASEHEGKTLLATQLAAGFARTGQKTLLLDCDFRNPNCHVKFGLPAGPGISEVLRGEAELETSLQAIPDSDARLLTAGQSDAKVIQSLSNGNFGALLGRLRAEFDCIIVDSAPTLVVSDGLLIGKLVDGVILVVRPKISKAPIVFSAHEQLARLNIPTLGAVINGNASRMFSSYYDR